MMYTKSPKISADFSPNLLIIHGVMSTCTTSPPAPYISEYVTLK